MEFLIGIVIGFLIGAITIYVAQQSKIKFINQKLKETRRILDDSEAATRGHAVELQELKLEQEKIRQLQTEQKSRQQELEKSYKTEIEELRLTAEDKFKEQESVYKAQLKEQEDAYQAPIEALLAERQEHLVKIQQYESQIQALNQGDVIPEGEEDFSEELLLESPGESEESVEKIESILDLFSDLVAEPEPVAPPTTPRQVTEKIAAIAASSKAAAIPQLTQYIHDSDSKVRALVATTFGKIVEEKNQGTEIKQLISSLGKLSRDSDLSVRQSAVAALGKVDSVNVIPLLKIAQRDTDSDVVKSASAALSKFKGYRLPGKKKALPKNASAAVKNSEI
jgi:HEAT repeat protein